MPAWRARARFAVAGVALALAGCGLGACVPLRPERMDLVGKWHARQDCGIEHLELRSDSTYVQRVEFNNGETARNEGFWTVRSRNVLEPHRGFALRGGDVVLRRAMICCDPDGHRYARPEQFDLDLDANWEWGRPVLEFNPDLEGFTRD